MERRLTAFVIPVLLLTVLFMFLFPEPEHAPEDPPRLPRQVVAEPQTTTDASGQEFVFARSFGTVGEAGGFWIEFDRRGASVRTIRLLDEPATPADHDAANRAIEDCYAVVRPVEPGLTSFGIAELEGRLSVNLEGDQANPWTYEDLAAPERGVRFTLRDAREGITFEKVFRHEPGSRELVVSLAMTLDEQRPDSAQIGKDRKLTMALYGASLVNPEVDFILGQNPAIALAASEGAGSPQIHSARPSAQPQTTTQTLMTREGPSLIGFAGSTNRFFAGFLRPANDAARESLYHAAVAMFPRYHPDAPQSGKDDTARGQRPYSVPVPEYRLRFDVRNAGQREEQEYRVYLGPKSSGVFETRPEYERYHAVMNLDLAPMCFCDIPGATMMAKLLLGSLRGLHSLVGSWGLAIVLLTLIVRGCLVPLNFRMQKSMRAYGAKMMRLKPQLDAIKERGAKSNNPKQMQQEMLAFQREHKLFPPVGGCLPLLVTIPIFLGLFTALRVAYELRCEPFVGWIADLSQPDQLATLAFWPHQFNLLPIIMVVLWLVLQMGTPLPDDPQQRQMMKIMRFMPLMFGVMLYKYAAGLMVYMITSSALGIVEQRVTRKILGPPPSAAGAIPTAF